VADNPDVVATIVADCEQYWRTTRVPPRAIEEMTVELETHLREAEAANKRPETVVGNDLTAFAESWASAYRLPPADPPTVDSTYKPRKFNWWLLAAWGGALLVATALIGAFAPKEESVDNGVWIGIWLGLMILFGIGEMLTAGFFLLPFAIGAAVAAVLAVIGVTVPIQMLVFIVVSILALWGFQRFAKSDKEPLYPVGVKRYTGALAMVLEDIDAVEATGIVRMENEEWRATTDWDRVIEAGTTVRVVEVRGTRLVVEPAGANHEEGFDHR
jgi:membrane protein implicated in regulation of membrane protease activity